MSVTTYGRKREPLVGGIVLVLVGIGLLAAQFYPDLIQYIVLAIGIGLLGLFVLTRSYGALVGGAIVTGIGAGIVFAQLYEGELGAGLLLVSLGTGFLAIWAISYLLRLAERHWWPLVPGLIIGSVGAAVGIGATAIELLAYWPVVLIVIGLIMLGSSYFRLARPASPPSE